MKTIKLLLYIRNTQPDISIREEKLILHRVKTCSSIIKERIVQLVDGQEDPGFGYTIEGVDGQKVTLTIGTLVNDFGLPVLQSYLFLDWFGKDPSSALAFLKSHDNLQLDSNREDSDEKHDDKVLEEEF